MNDIPDFDTIPESFYSIGWWDKPNPFPEDMNEGRKRRQFLRDNVDQLKELNRIAREGFVGLYAGGGSHNKWPEQRSPEAIEVPDAKV